MSRSEAQRLLGESRAAAENIKRELVAAAQEEIGEQRERAKKEINLERARAVDELKQVTVELTLEASAVLLQRELRDEDHRRLAREVVEEVATRL
jgi:F-type H+-transporting ATPase subunit b